MASPAAQSLTPPKVRLPNGVEVLATPAAGPAAARGATLRMGSFVIGSLFSAAAAALLFRYLGVVDTGRYTIAMSLAALASGLTDLGLTGVGLRELSVLHGERRAAFMRDLLGMRLTLALIGVLLVVAFAFVAYGPLLGVGVSIACGGVLLQNTQGILGVSLSVRLRLGWLSALELARLLFAAGTIALLVLVGASLLAFLAATAIASALVLPVLIPLVRGDIPLRPAFAVGRWRALVTPMLTYSAAVVTATLYLRVAVVLVSLLSNGRQLGYFGVSYRIVENLFTLPGLLVGAAFPIFAHTAFAEPERFAGALARVFEAALIVGVWTSLSLLVGAHLAIALVGGPKFMAAVPVLAVQGLAVGAVFVSTVWSTALLSLRLHRTILVLNLALLALVALLVAALAPVYGAQGAAAATAGVEIIAAITGGVLLVRGRPQLRPSLSVLPKVGLAAAVGATPMLLAGAPVLVRVALSSGLYVAVLLWRGALPADLGDLLGVRRLALPRLSARRRSG
jgi:O-antigen/teichoic acid export membrane protein